MKAYKVSPEEKEKRKEVARRRTFWFLIVFNVLLIAYIFIQVIMMLNNK